MKNSKTFFSVVILLLLFNSLMIGCQSSGTKQPSNPFAMNRQTAPPPATFSHQSQFLGQSPSVYLPQLPAATYPSPGTAAPNSIPMNVPLPSGTTPAPTNSVTPNGSYGSIYNSGNATLFQTSATNSVPFSETPSETPSATPSENEWTATDSSFVAAEIPTTRETVFQNLESKNNSVMTTDSNGIVRTMYAEPETFAVSSSQMVTQVTNADSPPETVPAQPQSVYAGKYQ
jgi:hypothetical protein